MFDAIDCVAEPLYSYILGIFLCIAGTISYIPQYYSLIKSEQTEGISELSLLILNIGNAALTANSFILNYGKFQCYQNCSAALCTGNLLPLMQITVGWLVVLPLYFMFVRYKIKKSKNRVLNDIRYIITYVVFIVGMMLFGIIEKTVSTDSSTVFHISAIMLGILAALCSCVVWIPQIVKLIQTQNPAGLSLLMFGLQTPGNIMIIILQMLYRESWTTWISYLVLFVEQLTIIIILLVLKYRARNNVVGVVVNDEMFEASY